MKPIDLNELKPPPELWNRLTEQTRQNITLTYCKSIRDKLTRLIDYLEFLERTGADRNGI